MRFAIFVFTRELVAIIKLFGAFAVLEPVPILAFVSVSIFPLVYAVAIDFAFPPFTDVGISVYALPDSKAFFDALNPVAVVDFSIRPGVDALAVWFVAVLLA